MEKKEILVLLEKQAASENLRDLISQIARKLISYGIDLTVPLDEKLVKPELNTDLTALKSLLGIKAENYQLLQAVIDFYFTNVKKAF